MLNNQKILVAGAGGLLGAMLVKELVKHGADVLAVDIDLTRVKIRFDELDIDTQDGKVTLHQIDLSDKNAVSTLFSIKNDLTGAVNCSYPRNKNYGKHFFDVAVEDFNENISLNLGASFLFMQQCASYFKRTNSPFSLVNISSIYGVIPPKFEVYDNTSMTMPVEYAAIKSGLIHLSKYVTKYVGSSQFRINTVSPGGIFDNQPSQFLEQYKRETLGKGMLDVSDVMGAIIFLLSSMSEFINGQNIIVDDGFSM